MITEEIEQEKAFILDTIRRSGMPRCDIIMSLARARHIDEQVWNYIGKHHRETSAATIDFIANFPAATQNRIIDAVKTDGVNLATAILLVTGETFSEDAAEAAHLLAIWARASDTTKKMFLKKIGREK